MGRMTGRKGLRAALALSSTLVPAAAAAQSLPGPAQVASTSVSPGGTAPVVSNPTATSLQVDLKANATVINWNGFNVPAANNAQFSDTRATPLTTPIAVLNRDVSGVATPSQILGSIGSDANVAVWVYSPGGVVVGPNAAINTGSLVLTALDPGAAAFLRGQSSGSYRLTSAANSAAAVRIDPGAAITLGSGNRGLVLVAPAIDSAGTLAAGGQDAAFVTATDVTLAYTPGSPLDVTINRGTAVPGTAQRISGTVGGQNVTFAMATQGSVVDSLLQIDAAVSAVAGPRGIVIVAGRPAAATTGVTVAAGASGTVDLAAAGSLTASGAGADVVARASGDAALTASATATRDVILAAEGTLSTAGALTAGRDVTLTAATTLASAGAVDAGRTYLARARSVTLGGTDPAAAILQSADGALTVEATGGTIAGGAGLTLQANADGAGTEALTITTSGTAGGDIALGGVTLLGGAARESDVVIRSRTAANTVTLGNVAARALTAAVGAASATPGITRTSALTLGDVTVTAPLALQAASIATGALASDGNVSLTTPGVLTTGAVTAGGRIAIAGTGLDTTTGVLTARGGDVSVERAGAVTLGGADASQDFIVGATVRPATLAITGPARATRALALTATGAVTTDTLDGGTVTVRSLNGDIGVAGATSRAGGIALTADGAITLSGDSRAPTDFTATAGGAITSTANLSAGNDVVLTATGALEQAGAVTAGRDYRVTGAGVTLGGTDPAVAVRQAAGGAVAIRSTADIAGGAGLTLASGAAGAADLTLTTDGAAGGDILFARATRLDAGAADVVIVSRTAANRVELGDIAADELLGAVGAAAPTPGLVRTSAIVTGDVTLTGPLLLDGAGVTTGAIDSGDAVAIVSSEGLATGDVTAAGEVRFTGVGTGATSAGEIVAGTDVTIERAGALTLGSVDAARAVTIGAVVRPASVDVAGGLEAGTRLAVASGGDVRVAGDAVAGDDLSITSGGAITLGGRIGAGTDLRLDAVAAIDAARLDVTGNADLVSRGSDVILGGPSRVAGALTIDAAQRVTLAGDLTSATLDARGASIILAGVVIDIAGRIDLTARTGGITGGGDLRLTGGSAAAPLALRAGGAAGIRFAANSAVTARGTLALYLAPGAPLSLGDVTAARLSQLATLDGDAAAGSASLVIAAPVTLGDVRLAEALSLRVVGAGLATGDLTAPGITLRADDGAIRTGDIDTRGGALALDAGTDLTLGDAAAGTIAARAGGTLTGASLAAQGTADVTASRIALDSLRSSSAAIRATATGADTGDAPALSIGSVATPDAILIDASSGSAVLGFVSGNVGVTATAADTLSIGTLNGEALVAIGTTVDLREVTGGTLEARAGDALTIGGSATLTGGALLRAGGALRTGSLTLGAGGLDAEAGGSATITRIDSDGAVSVSGATLALGRTDGRGDYTFVARTGDAAIDSAEFAGNGLVDVAGTLTAGPLSADDLSIRTGGSLLGNALVARGDLDVLAGGDVRVRSGVNRLTVRADGDLSIDAGGAIEVYGESGARSVTLAGRSIRILDQISTDGPATLTARGGDIVFGTLLARGATTLAASGSIGGSTLEVGSLTANAGDAFGATIVRSVGDATIRSVNDTRIQFVVDAGGALDIVSGGSITGSAMRGNRITLDAGGRIGIGGAIESDSDVLASASSMLLGSIDAVRDVLLDATGTIGTYNITAGRNVTATGSAISFGPSTIGGDLSMAGTAGGVGLGGTVATTVGGSARLVASEGIVVGTLDVGGALRLEGASLNATALDAGTTLDAAITGAAEITGATTTGGAATIAAGSLTSGAITTDGALRVTATRDLTLGAARAGGAATLDVGGLATLAGLSASPSISLTAADAELNGTLAAASVTIVNRLAASQTLRVGDGPAAGGFRLSNAEVGRIETGTLTLDGGTGSIELGTLAFDADAGRSAVNLWAGGRVDVNGAVSGNGAGRTFFIGGRPTANGGVQRADTIRVTATADGGGRLLFDTANVELNADRIGVGQAAGFLDAVGFGGAGASPEAVASRFVSNPGSSLYNAVVGGGTPYAAGAQTLVSAGRLTVRYSRYALFQNTGEQGLNTGAVLSSGSGPALVLDASGGNPANGFALFGSINGVTGISAAILGAQTIETDGINLPASRVNGCIIGSAAGCLTTVISQAPLNIFDSSRLNVFAASDDFALPFDPVIGSNNEALFTGAFANDPGVPIPECDQVEPGRCVPAGEQP